METQYVINRDEKFGFLNLIDIPTIVEECTDTFETPKPPWFPLTALRWGQPRSTS